MSKFEEELAWSLYWADGPLHSCVAGADPKDQAIVDAVWLEFAQSLPKGAKVLDAATGNGAVASLLFKARGDLRIDAFDKAKIIPTEIDTSISSGCLEFHPEIDVLAPPFKSGSYSAICSQFGVEYAGLERAIKSLMPLLAPSAQFQFLVHHTSSDLIKSSYLKEVEFSLLVDEGGLLDSLMNVLKGEKSVQEFEQQGKLYLSSGLPMTKGVTGQVFSGIEQVLTMLDDDFNRAKNFAVALNLRCRAEYSRLCQMRESASDESQVLKAVEIIRADNIVDVSYAPFSIPGESKSYLIGWLISGHTSD